MNISFLGGAREVGGSCILLKINNKNILLDCGIRQGASKDPIPDFKIIQESGGIDAIIVSHAHMDHIGCLPIISKEYPAARIYTNVMTKDLMKVLLYDSLKIMNNREEEIPLYAESDVKAMLNRVFPINYMVEFPMFEGIKLCFYTAGHIAGASCVYIKSPEGSLFYSGDFSVFSQKTVEGLKIPKLRPDVGIFETTYGDRLHSNREVEEQKLVDIIEECVSSGGKMLIPAFALGRAQEVILIIKRAMNKGIIKNTKVYVDGMIRDIARVYKLNPLYLKNSLGKKILRGIEPFYDDNIIPVENRAMREKILEDKDSCVIISSSGMLTGGFSQYYAEKLAPCEDSYIVITGYQDEESPGRKLLNLLEDEDKTLELNGRIIPVKCKVAKVGLSAHSDKGEIKSLIKMLSPKDIFMIHGNEDVIQSFSKEIASESRSRVYSPKCGESYSINVNRPRKQLSRHIGKTMKGNTLNEIDVKKLWEFVMDNYGQKNFTVEELAFIWTGNEGFTRDIDKNSNDFLIESMMHFQHSLVESVYFENDVRRLFLFKPKLKKEVEELLKPHELKPNELNDIVNKYFSSFNFKKASLIYKEKKIVLNFDFPLVVDDKIYEVIEEFKRDVEWNVEISNTTNINEVSVIVNEMLKNADIKKISYRLNERTVKVILNSYFDVPSHITDEFLKRTGLFMSIEYSNRSINNKGETPILSKGKNNSAMEQNAALSVIDNEFKDKKFKPYKKSIKSCNGEKYIELSFITNVIGRKYIKEIEKLSEKTGWDIKISDSANQNDIINILKSICNMHNIELKKNPSFMIDTLTAGIKLEKSYPEEKINIVKDEFECKTGCTLVVDVK
ncbi:MBL fold metallo-hydrolase [Clostridium sp. cel8]|uniref:MBL fold metallo-hydrolase n=1 Tax=Clostridium sp. cel8 TaxID=2663123 RepID=UPI0015F55590|nr:MBL fold metallo-hydrolase [Clostridium sp. cel8]MBA5850950.1 MBL fold metallo-hydrolase [Clostridium sp. cel8]